MKETAKNYLIARFKEPSTWKGLTVMLAATGVNMAPDLALSIASIGAIAVGAIDAGRTE